jgi:hypothetical protein
MTRFFLAWNAKSGDSVIFTSAEVEGNYRISIKKSSVEDIAPNKAVILRGWKAIY